MDICCKYIELVDRADFKLTVGKDGSLVETWCENELAVGAKVEKNWEQVKKSREK